MEHDANQRNATVTDFANRDEAVRKRCQQS